LATVEIAATRIPETIALIINSNIAAL